MSCDLSQPCEQPSMDNLKMTKIWTIEGAREDLEAMIQNVEKDITILEAALENKDRKAVAKSLTLTQSTVAAVLEAIEIYGDHLLAEKKIDEFQMEKIAQRNLHKSFFFLQYDAERFLDAANKKSKGKCETRPGGGDIGHGVVINQGYRPTPFTTSQIDEELALQHEEARKKKELEHEDDVGAKHFPPTISATNDETDSGGGSKGAEVVVNQGCGPTTTTTTCQNSDDKLALQQEEKQDCEHDDDGAKQFPSPSTTKDEIAPGGGSRAEEDWDNKGNGPTPATTCQNSDDELFLQQEEDNSFHHPSQQQKKTHHQEVVSKNVSMRTMMLVQSKSHQQQQQEINHRQEMVLPGSRIPSRSSSAHT